MSRYFAPVLSILVVFSLTVPAFAQGPAAPIPWANKMFLQDIEKNPSQPPPPVIVQDFGTIPYGTLCSHKFTITNIYDVPMQVLDIRRSCGCMEAFPPLKVLQPTETAEFLITMDAGKFKGPGSQTIHVTFGPRFISQAIIRVTANSRADVTLNPGLIQFGTVAQGTTPTAMAELRYQGKQKDWKVTGAVAPTGPLTIDVKEAPRDSAAVKYYVSANLKADAPAGAISEVISLKTNDPTAPVIQVKVAGSVLAPLTLSTNHVQFAGVKVGEIVSHKVILRGTEPFKIQPVGDAGDGLSVVDVLPAAGPAQVITVRFQPTRPGPVRRDIAIKTDLKGGTTAVIQVEADAEAAAIVPVVPAAVPAPPTNPGSPIPPVAVPKP